MLLIYYKMYINLGQYIYTWDFDRPRVNCHLYRLLSLDRYSANILTAWSSGAELPLISSRTTAYFLCNKNKNRNAHVICNTINTINRINTIAQTTWHYVGQKSKLFTWAMYALYKKVSLSMSFSGLDGLKKRQHFWILANLFSIATQLANTVTNSGYQHVDDCVVKTSFKKWDTYLHFLGFIYTLLIVANIIGVFYIEKLIDITLLSRHVDNFLTRSEKTSCSCFALRIVGVWVWEEREQIGL